MPVSPAGLRFPYTRVLLPRTRLAYIHLQNLLNDAKRDRAARISGYVAISLPDELVILYLLAGELVNATVRDAKGGERTVSIVGVDEIDTARGYVSWVSPIARALLRAREGDTVPLHTPGGVEELEIVAVRYVPLATGDGVAVSAAG